MGLNDVNQGFKNRMFYWRAKINKLHNAFRVRYHWVDFVLYWIIFDAYLTEVSGLDKDNEKLDYFFKNANDFKKCMQEKKCWVSSLSPYVNKLKNLSPIEDMRPSKQRLVYLKNENSIKDVFSFIYQIRCNVFHGSKNIKDLKDDALVLNAAKFLGGAFDYIDNWQPN